MLTAPNLLRHLGRGWTPSRRYRPRSAKPGARRPEQEPDVLPKPVPLELIYITAQFTYGTLRVTSHLACHSTDSVHSHHGIWRSGRGGKRASCTHSELRYTAVHTHVTLHASLRGRAFGDLGARHRVPYSTCTYVLASPIFSLGCRAHLVLAHMVRPYCLGPFRQRCRPPSAALSLRRRFSPPHKAGVG